MISFKNKRFSILHAIVLAILIAVITFATTSFWKERQFASKMSSTPSYTCNYNVKRMDGFKYIKPLMFVDEECESAGLMSIKQKLMGIIDAHKTAGDITNTSVYLREYSNNEWICINDNEKYDPGSLFKVPVLIAILKTAEDNPGFLNKSVTYNKPINTGKTIAYASKTIKLGQSYTIRELLTYMIKYSDNSATVLVEQNLNPKVLHKLFSVVGLEVPNIYASQYQFTTKEYSYFMRAIYNAGYLSSEDSELAGELLTQCDFKDGIVQGLPADIKLAHKFGESGSQNEKQLHESAIVYLKNKPYLLTVMTRGKDNKKLSQVIGEISQAVYNDMLNEANATL
jgi:beta-lactamase class A